MTHPPESLPTQEKINLEIMQKDFCGMFDESKKEESKELFKKIVGQYQEGGRKYHNLTHVEKVLAFLRLHEQEINDINGVKLAAYFHDVVYDTKASDNEERSAQYAQDCLVGLDISDYVASHVVGLIRATTKHQIIENDTDSAIFLDADLVILGSNEEEYDRYAAKIREEYAWVPDDQYRVGRKKVLQNFLSRSRIYFTELAGKELEQKARKNIERELETLF